MRKLSTVEIVQELLRTYQDVTCPLNQADQWIGDKPGSRVLTRPDNHPYFTGSYRQLEAILRHMRDTMHDAPKDAQANTPQKYRAITVTYITSERRLVTRTVHERVRGKGTVAHTVTISEPVLRSRVLKQDLDAGIDWIAQEFKRRQLVPWLPPEIHEQAAA